MKNRISGILWGCVLIFLGLALGGNALELWDYDMFFDGWWTIFIIVPSIIGLVSDGPRFWNIAGLIIGGLLLGAAQGLFFGIPVWRLIFPIILVAGGLSIIFRRRFAIPKTVATGGSDRWYNLVAIFGGQEQRVVREVFEGAEMTAVFGGVELDIREAIIEHDVKVSMTCVFGGAELFVPPNVKVKVSNIPVFGGVSNKAIQSPAEDAPTVYVEAVTVFGGSEIK